VVPSLRPVKSRVVPEGTALNGSVSDEFQWKNVGQSNLVINHVRDPGVCKD
jgi:hypothetical protein